MIKNVYKYFISKYLYIFMATFRQNQIEEILNYDRAMNRIVLDNEIGQATRFNDERRPPTNRDIKFEALLGTLIDALKAKIAEALTSIAAKQYPKITASKASHLLALDTSPNNKYVFHNQNHEARKKAIEQQKNTNLNNQLVEEAQNATLSRNPGVQQVLDRTNNLSNDSTTNDNTPGSAPQATANMTEAEFLAAYETGPPATTNQTGVASGKPAGKIRDFFLRPGTVNTGYGGVAREQGAQTERTGLEKEKSITQTTNATENILYEIINQYNGIIDKLLQATQPNGAFASKRMASSANVQYLADVLKGLNEPLKHLNFELTQVHNPNLATVLNMMRQLVEVIDISPPFQKINVAAYKNGMPDFQGINNVTQVIDINGYIADLINYRTKIEHLFNQVTHNISAVVFNAPPELKKQYEAKLKSQAEHYKKLWNDLGDEINKVEKRKKFTEKFEANYDLISRFAYTVEDLEKELAGEPAGPIKEFMSKVVKQSKQPIQKSPDQSLPNYLTRLQDEKEHLDVLIPDLIENKTKIDNLEMEPKVDTTYLQDQINVAQSKKGEIERLIEVVQEFINGTRDAPSNDDSTYQEIENFINIAKNSTNDMILGSYDEQIYLRDEALAQGNQSKAALHKTQMDLLKRKYPNQLQGRGKHRQVMGRGKHRQVMGSGVLMDMGRNIGMGGSAGLADLLAERHPQLWNNRETQLYDYDNQYRETINREREWHAKSIPIHTTPIGSLYPFYKKDAASLYSFPLKLRNELSITKPDDTMRDARGADISLLQGPIGNTVPEQKRPPLREAKRTVRTQAENTKNIIKGQGKKKNPKALHKILFNDESNEPFEDEDMPEGKGGMILEEPEDEPEDRFRNKKLGPPKKKYGKK